MRLNDAIQWACLALIAAGCFLIWIPLGLIVTGILGFAGSTLQELATARRKGATSARNPS